MVEVGGCRFVIAIERRHGIGDRLSAVVVLQNVLDIGQCRKAAEGRIAEFQLIAISQFKCGNIPGLNIAIVGVLLLHGSDVCTCAVQQSKLRIVCSVLFEVEAQGRLGVQDQAVAVICDPLSANSAWMLSFSGTAPAMPLISLSFRLLRG